MEFFITGIYEKSLGLLYCGHQQCAPGHSWGPGIRDHYLLHYVRSGEGVYRLKGSEFKVRAGESFLLFPGLSGHYVADKRDPWAYDWVAFGGSLAEECLGLSNLSPSMPVHRHEDRQAFELLLERLFAQARQNTITSEISSIGWWYQMFALLMKETHLNRIEATPKETNLKEQYVDKAIRFIQTYYPNQHLSVSAMAGMLGLERTYFSKIFREILDQTPHHFIVQYRLEKASRLLTHTDMTIARIAKSVGFDDEVYFSKVFKRNRGFSPSFFRKGGHNQVERERPE